MAHVDVVDDDWPCSSELCCVAANHHNSKLISLDFLPVRNCLTILSLFLTILVSSRRGMKFFESLTGLSNCGHEFSEASFFIFISSSSNFTTSAQKVQLKSERGRLSATSNGTNLSAHRWFRASGSARRSSSRLSRVAGIKISASSLTSPHWNADFGAST